MFTVIITVLLMATNKNGQAVSADVPPYIYYTVAIVIALASVSASFVVFGKKVAAAKQQTGLKAMLENYRLAVIFRFALMEGPALFAVIVYFLTGQFTILPLVGLILAIMVFVVPTKQRAIADLELSSQQAAIVNDDEAVIE